MLKIAMTAAAASLLGACASGGGAEGPNPQSRQAQAGAAQPGVLLRHARAVQTEQGCAAAIPAYRVISGFGEGYEAAQYELGECLLAIDSGNIAELHLFRTESVFWLRRAAWAGEARAQGKLAEILSGAPGHDIDGVAADPVEALTWATVYGANVAHSLYTLPDVPEPVLAHLNATVTPSGRAEAEAAAAAFAEIDMAAFTPPRSERARNAEGRQGAGQRGGRRRPR